MDIIVPILVVIGVIVFWAVITYNKLVAKRERVRESCSGTDVQLKRRSNVVGNLVNTVKGYAEHESETLEAVTQMRARAEAAAEGGTGERQAAEGELSTALIRLFAVAENYPELKADGTFIELQKTLSELKDEIQMARRFYNGRVRNLNTSIGSVPGNIIAKQFAFQPAEYYEVDHASDKILPKVEF